MGDAGAVEMKQGVPKTLDLVIQDVIVRQAHIPNIARGQQFHGVRPGPEMKGLRRRRPNPVVFGDGAFEVAKNRIRPAQNRTDITEHLFRRVITQKAVDGATQHDVADKPEPSPPHDASPAVPSTSFRGSDHIRTPVLMKPYPVRLVGIATAMTHISTI
jgi:hypothetical protein